MWYNPWDQGISSVGDKMSDDRAILMEKETSSWLNQPVKPKHAKKHTDVNLAKLIMCFVAGLVVGKCL